MDPNETLKQLRALLSGDHSGVDTQEQSWEAITDDHGNTKAENLLTMACEAEELFQALDKWINEGGALPTDWAKYGSRDMLGQLP